MRSFEINLFPKPETRGDEYWQFDDVLHSFLNALRRDNNIGREWQILELENYVQVRAVSPETASLNERYWNIYAREYYEKLMALSQKTAEFYCIPERQEKHSICLCESSPSYVLFTTFLNVQFPVKCLGCNEAVPLYRLPYLRNEKEHYTLSKWQQSYEALDLLFMYSGTGERYSYQQLHNPRSNFNKETRQLAKELEEKTGKPVYIFLLHHYEDFGDKCPLCKRGWRVEEAQDLFAFRCDHCRLLSQEAPDSATPLSKLHP